MKVNILSPGRFHVLDLARELEKNGFDVKFYSYVPTKRAVSYGLPKKCSKSLFLLMLPFLVLSKIFKGHQWVKQLKIWMMDHLTALVMRKCDILISMSGDFVYAPRKAKKQGSKIIIERGSKHILEQRNVLESLPSNLGKKPVPDFNVERELECYKLADFISIASETVKRSFIKQCFDMNKVYVNPYGVNLKDFYPNKEVKKEYDIIMVGGWSYRKGCDLISEVASQTDYKFLHVGGIVDCPLPTLPNFTHIDPVDQRELVKYYNKAKVFILPSREEGLSMVQAQAIACNLPVIGSVDSGAEDLKRMVKYPEYITIVESYDVESVQLAIRNALAKYSELEEKIYAGDAIQNLTWEAYGKRYSEFILKNINYDC